MYAGTFVLIACSFSLLLTTAMRGGTLVSAAAHAEFTRRNRDCYFIGLPLYVIATFVAPYSVWLSLGICTGLWVFWVGRSIESARRGETQNPKPAIRILRINDEARESVETRNQKPETRNQKPETRNQKPETRRTNQMTKPE